jgi:hypothetical protein
MKAQLPEIDDAYLDARMDDVRKAWDQVQAEKKAWDQVKKSNPIPLNPDLGEKRKPKPDALKRAEKFLSDRWKDLEHARDWEVSSNKLYSYLAQKKIESFRATLGAKHTNELSGENQKKRRDAIRKILALPNDPSDRESGSIEKEFYASGLKSAVTFLRKKLREPEVRQQCVSSDILKDNEIHILDVDRDTLRLDLIAGNLLQKKP